MRPCPGRRPKIPRRPTTALKNRPRCGRWTNGAKPTVIPLLAKTPESDANTIPDFEPTPNNHLYEGLKVLYSEAKAELACKDLESQTLTQDFKNVRSQFGSALTVIEDLNAKNQSLSDRVGSIESNLE